MPAKPGRLRGGAGGGAGRGGGVPALASGPAARTRVASVPRRASTEEAASRLRLDGPRCRCSSSESRIAAAGRVAASPWRSTLRPPPCVHLCRRAHPSCTRYRARARPRFAAERIPQDWCASRARAGGARQRVLPCRPGRRRLVRCLAHPVRSTPVARGCSYQVKAPPGRSTARTARVTSKSLLRQRCPPRVSLGHVPVFDRPLGPRRLRVAIPSVGAECSPPLAGVAGKAAESGSGWPCRGPRAKAPRGAVPSARAMEMTAIIPTRVVHARPATAKGGSAPCAPRSVRVWTMRAPVLVTLRHFSLPPSTGPIIKIKSSQ